MKRLLKILSLTVLILCVCVSFAACADSIGGSYRGYISDGGSFEIRLTFRSDDRWVIIEEDGDVNGYGEYEKVGDNIILYETYNGKRERVGAGEVDGKKIRLTYNGRDIVFSQIK